MFGEPNDSRSNQSDYTRVTLKSVFETNKSPFCIQLMIVCVFQHKSDIFRLIDVINGVIFIFSTIVGIDITSNQFLDLYHHLVWLTTIDPKAGVRNEQIMSR